MNAWAVVELMGHQRAIGYVTEVTIAGASFLQIETPASATAEAKVRIVAPASIYAINPTTEERILSHLRPPERFELGAPAHDDGDEDEDDEEGGGF